MRDAEQVYGEASADPYLSLWKHVPLWAWYLAVFILAFGLLLFKKLSMSELLIFVSMLFFGLAMWAANMVCVYYMHRYALTLLVPMIAALVFTVGTVGRDALFEGVSTEKGQIAPPITAD